MPDSDDDDLRPRQARSMRHDGWSVELQLRFLEALAAHGHVGHVGRAAAAVERSASSAYRLRGRSESFERAWHAASAMAYHRLRDLALDRIDFGEVTQQLYHGEVVATRTRYSDRLLIAMLDHLKPVAVDSRSSNSLRPAADPGIAYASVIAAYATAIETGVEPQVPVMEDDGRKKPVMTREEFMAAIRMRPRVSDPGEEDDWGRSAANCAAADAAGKAGEENDFSARA